MANDVAKKRKGLRQQVLANQQRPKPSFLGEVAKRSKEVIGDIRGGYQRAGVPGAVGAVGKTIARGSQELAGLSQRAGEAVTAGGGGVAEGIRAGFTGQDPHRAVSPPVAGPDDSAGAAPPPPVATTPVATTPGARRGVGALPAHLANQPAYQEAAQLKRTGPAGIREGTVGKYPAGETPFTQSQFERANTIRKAEEQGIRAKAISEGYAAEDPSKYTAATSGTGGYGSSFFAKQPRQYKESDFVTRSGGDRILNVAALKAAGLNVDQVLAAQKDATTRAGQVQQADIAQAAGLRAEKKLASDERRARLTGIRETGAATRAEERYQEKRGTEQERYMTGRVDKAAADISTRLEDGERVTVPGAEEEFRSFIGQSGGAQSEGGLNVMKGLYKFGKAMQRAQGEAQNPLQSLRNVPVLGGLIRGLDERGTPNINTAQVKAALKSYDPKTRTYSVGAETIDESALGLEKGMVGKLLRDMLK